MFGWAVTSKKAVVGCGCRKNSCAEVAVEKAEDRLVEYLWLLQKSTNRPHMSFTVHTTQPSPSLTYEWGPLIIFFLHSPKAIAQMSIGARQSPVSRCAGKQLRQARHRHPRPRPLPPAVAPSAAMRTAITRGPTCRAGPRPTCSRHCSRPPVRGVGGEVRRR